jgi:hypothetical protein
MNTRLFRSIFLLASATASAALCAQDRQLALATPTGLSLHHVEAAAVTFQSRAALKLTASPAATSAQPAPTKQATGKKKSAAGTGEAGRRDHLALVDGVEFTDGTIEVDLAGEPTAGAAGGARGFVGVAFRVQPDRKTYDCFYLRPTNGRSDDQERRNHTAQYISHPVHTWSALREKTPSRYESYVDIVPATWIHVKIVVAGDKARLYVNHQEQPTLIINDVKSGAGAKGGIALWFEGTTIAHYANLKIQPAR